LGAWTIDALTTGVMVLEMALDELAWKCDAISQIDACRGWALRGALIAARRPALSATANPPVNDMTLTLIRHHRTPGTRTPGRSLPSALASRGDLFDLSTGAPEALPLDYHCGGMSSHSGPNAKA
jgi:hypothetical protein